ncbi:MAG TPA: Rrf2 family transcriptional regulator [Nitrospirota bacterium]|nr:Rrf2 family transcriptional regulator [Nitrospirota bacterium]
MRLSTRARYGMRMMLALAGNYGTGPMYLKDIASAEEISEKYLSLLVIPLKQAGLINSIRGAYGGYSLAKAPSQINLGEIVEILEGDCIVDCLKDPSACPRISICTSHDIWAFLDEKISEALRSITLEQWLNELERKGRASLKSVGHAREKRRRIK